MDTFTENRAKLLGLLDDHPVLGLRQLGPTNLGTFERPEIKHGAMFVTHEEVDGHEGQRGRVMVFVPFPKELLAEDPTDVADWLLFTAEEGLKVQARQTP